ncbi:TPA: hypothetical protein EYP26_04045 [Candidatus Bathyarchaeota archaeon]|nr:hypothetical protein [Candidatus Bathyarchaeota archaeon]
MESKRMLVIGLAISVVFVVIGCALLATSAETLDEIAEKLGASETSFWNPPIPDYELPGFEGNVIVNIMIGVLFTLLVFAAALGAGEALRRRKPGA